MESTCDISLKTWLSENEAIVYTSLSRPTLRKARQSGKLPYRIMMGKIIYDRIDIDNWIKRESKYLGLPSAKRKL